jgi:predicted HTH domain antitoxin
MKTVQLTDELVDVMKLNGKPLDRLVQELLVLELYRLDEISSGKAAELLGMPRADFIRFSGERGIPYFRMSKEEWEDEMRTLGLR